MIKQDGVIYEKDIKPFNKKEKKALVRFIAEHCIRNTELENLHSGIYPLSLSGDYSDVKVVTPYGEIPWNGVSRFGDKEMRILMLDIEKKLMSFINIIEPIKHVNMSKNTIDGIVEQYKNGVSWDWVGFKKNLQVK